MLTNEDSPSRRANPYLPFFIPPEDVNRSATHGDDGIVRATSRVSG